MEVRRVIAGFILLLLLAAGQLRAQSPGSYTMKNGKMYIRISKGVKEAAIDSFLRKFDIMDLPLKQYLRNGVKDSLQKLGWRIEANNNQYCEISKPLAAAINMSDPAEKITMAAKHQLLSDLYPENSKPVIYGYNKFRNNAFAVSGTSVRFIIRNHLQAKRVYLAGSFNAWSPSALAMIKTDSGWIANVKLEGGKYWYKFIVDGNWMLDEDNRLNEGDGRGNVNSVYFKTNSIFRFPNNNFRRVFLSGSFNNWKKNEIALNKVNTFWELPFYLTEGTHTYKFVADGNWLSDPSNNDKLPDGIGNYNSVISIGKPYQFKLPGFTNAKQVVLTGSFNGWKRDELYMSKTQSGWALPYVLGEGNYEYKFLVDGKSVTDPTNQLITNPGKDQNSLLVIQPNYTFRLKGFANAKTVVLSGDFSGWSYTMMQMKKTGDEWVLPINLSPGKHLYKYLIDGQWIIDPGNKLWEQNEYGTGNSVVWIDPK